MKPPKIEKPSGAIFEVCNLSNEILALYRDKLITTMQYNRINSMLWKRYKQIQNELHGFPMDTFDKPAYSRNRG